MKTLPCSLRLWLLSAPTTLVHCMRLRTRRSQSHVRDLGLQSYNPNIIKPVLSLKCLCADDLDDHEPSACACDQPAEPFPRQRLYGASKPNFQIRCRLSARSILGVRSPYLKFGSNSAGNELPFLTFSKFQLL